jgi:heme/copper-type cytochrome/quinol oxidase subunit 4
MSDAILFALLFATYVVMIGRYADGPSGQTLFAIAALAIGQTMVQLRYFLHITRKSAPIESIVPLLFALVLLVLMIGGSLWIMTNLDALMGM